MLRLVTEFLANEGSLVVSSGSILDTLLQVNFLHFASISLPIVCAAVLVLVSRFTTDTSGKDLSQLTFRRGELAAEGNVRNDRLLTILLILSVLIIWFIFSPWGMA